MRQGPIQFDRHHAGPSQEHGLGQDPRAGPDLDHQTSWTESGGDRSVFGLNTSQIIDVVDILRERGMLDCLEMLHYHLGSQIPNIRNIRGGIAEARIAVRVRITLCTTSGSVSSVLSAAAAARLGARGGFALLRHRTVLDHRETIVGLGRLQVGPPLRQFRIGFQGRDRFCDRRPHADRQPHTNCHGAAELQKIPARKTADRLLFLSDKLKFFHCLPPSF